MWNLILDSLGYLMLLLVLYVILFKLYYAGHRYWWMWPAAIVFVILDFLVNMIPMSILMIDLPREWLVTDRMKRYKASPENRRTGLHRYHYWVADNMCLILNVFDKDGHC